MGIGCSVADRNRSLLITTKTWIVNPKIHGPCRRSAADLSSAADAPTYMSLGSHAKSGPRMRRSPRRATSYRRRNGSWALAVAHGRLRSHGLAPRQHLPRSTPERLEVSATAGRNRFAYECGLLTRANEEPHVTFSGPPLETVPSHRSVSAIPMGLGRYPDGERPWRFGDWVLLKWIPTRHAPLLPLASNTPQVSRDFECP